MPISKDIADKNYTPIALIKRQKMVLEIVFLVKIEIKDEVILVSLFLSGPSVNPSPSLPSALHLENK